MAARVEYRSGKKRDSIAVRFSWKGTHYYCSKNRDGYRFRDLDDAEASAAAISAQMHDARRGKGTFDPRAWVDLRPMGFAAKAQEWLGHNEDRLQHRQIAPGTLRVRRHYIRHYLVPFFGHLDVRQIRVGHIEDFIAQLPKHLSSKSIKDFLTELKALFSWLYRREEISRVPGIPQVRVERLQVRWMDRETWEKIYQFIPQADKPLFWIMRHYGLRPAEACALQWQDIDLKRGVFHVRRNYSYGEKGWELTDRPKSGSFRTLPISAGFRELVRGIHRSLGGHVFTHSGRNYSRTLYDSIWRKAVRDAGIPHLSLYQSTRHSFACLRVNEGIPTRDIGAVMGHADPKTTEHYLSILMERKAEVIEFDTQSPRKRKKGVRQPS